MALEKFCDDDRRDMLSVCKISIKSKILGCVTCTSLQISRRYKWLVMKISMKECEAESIANEKRDDGTKNTSAFVAETTVRVSTPGAMCLINTWPPGEPSHDCDHADSRLPEVWANSGLIGETTEVQSTQGYSLGTSMTTQLDARTHSSACRR